MCKLYWCDISRTVEDRVKLLLSVNRKSYMPRRSQQRMTLSDLEWLFHPHRALSLRWLSFFFHIQLHIWVVLIFYRRRCQKAENESKMSTITKQ